MPIYDRESDSARVYHLGAGDIKISHGQDADTLKWGQLLFSQGEPGEVGRYHEHPPGMLSTELAKPLTALVFDSVESLDVLIERANTLRGLMIEQTDEQQETR
jgi:hypothetical protein